MKFFVAICSTDALHGWPTAPTLHYTAFLRDRHRWLCGHVGSSASLPPALWDRNRCRHGAWPSPRLVLGLAKSEASKVRNIEVSTCLNCFNHKNQRPVFLSCWMFLAMFCQVVLPCSAVGCTVSSVTPPTHVGWRSENVGVGCCMTCQTFDCRCLKRGHPSWSVWFLTRKTYGELI